CCSGRAAARPRRLQTAAGAMGQGRHAVHGPAAWQNLAFAPADLYAARHGDGASRAVHERRANDRAAGADAPGADPDAHGKHAVRPAGAGGAWAAAGLPCQPARALPQLETALFTLPGPDGDRYGAGME